MTADLIRRIEAYQRGESQEITRILIDCIATLQSPAEGAQVTDDMRSAVRWAPSSAYWSERLREFFGPDAREGIDALERQLSAALAAPAPQAAQEQALRDLTADAEARGLYEATAPQAAPVALTDEQIAAGWKAWPEQSITSAAKAVRFVRSLGIPAPKVRETQMADVHGGPAFPVPLNPGHGWEGMAPCDGLTKREWFAGLALQGLLSDSAGVAMGIDPMQFARHARLLADAMLAAVSAPSQNGES